METISSLKELIVLASPNERDNYYKKVLNNIIDFQIEYGKKIQESGDNVLILSTHKLFNRYAEVLGKNSVLISPMQDIWMRDFTLTNPENPIMFRYTAAGQGGNNKKAQIISDEVQDQFYKLTKKAKLQFKETDFLNDGGNFVDDYKGNAVISYKFLKDNKINEKTAREKIKNTAKVNNVAFIESDEQGGLEHSDGVVSFVDENTLFVNSYEDDPQYLAEIKQNLQVGLPGVKIYELVNAYNTYDERFGSAFGLYINMLVTPKRIYFPQFDIPEDKIALDQVRGITSKDVIPIMSNKVSRMGGGVRCMSLQLRGENAKNMLTYVNKMNN